MCQSCRLRDNYDRPEDLVLEEMTCLNVPVNAHDLSLFIRFDRGAIMNWLSNLEAEGIIARSDPYMLNRYELSN